MALPPRDSVAVAGIDGACVPCRQVLDLSHSGRAEWLDPSEPGARHLFILPRGCRPGSAARARPVPTGLGHLAVTGTPPTGNGRRHPSGQWHRGAGNEPHPDHRTDVGQPRVVQGHLGLETLALGAVEVDVEEEVVAAEGAGGHRRR